MNLNVSDEVLKTHLAKFQYSLFQHPSKYFPLVFPPMSIVPPHSIYLCPICLEHYIYVTKNEVRYSISFSLDHFPPQNVGGKDSLLVCKTCNNTAGHEYEAYLLEMIAKERFSRKIPFSEIKTTSHITEVKGWHHSAISIDEEGNTHFRLTANDTKKDSPS